MEGGAAMNTLLIRTLANLTALYAAAALLDGVRISDTGALIIAALVLTLVNMLIRPLLLVLTFPINLLTLGLFTLVINTWMVFLTAGFVTGLTVRGLFAAFITGILVSMLNLMFQPSMRRRH
jgi:putative membrane protein